LISIRLSGDGRWDCVVPNIRSGQKACWACSSACHLLTLMACSLGPGASQWCLVSSQYDSGFNLCVKEKNIKLTNAGLTSTGMAQSHS